jgi:hypothetical protein
VRGGQTIISLITLALLGLTLAGCGGSHYDLRGSFKPSKDGKTYLAVDDDNGGACGPIKVDGAIWRYPIGQMGHAEPGIHSIKCGDFFPTGIAFEIKRGVVYRFNYWGP